MTSRRDQLEAHTFRRRRTALALVAAHRALDDELPGHTRPWLVGVAIVVLLAAGLAVAALLADTGAAGSAGIGEPGDGAGAAGFHRPEADR